MLAGMDERLEDIEASPDGGASCYSLPPVVFDGP